MVIEKKLTIYFIEDCLAIMSHFFLATFKILCLSLYFNNLALMCFYVDFFLFLGGLSIFFFLLKFYFIFYSMWISLEFNPYWSSEIGVLRFLNVYIHIFPQIWEAWDYFSQIIFLLISFFPCGSLIIWTLVHFMVLYSSLSLWSFSSFFFLPVPKTG